MYPLGTIKLTWINPNDFSVLESQMYDPKRLDLALADAKGKPDWMIFQLTSTTNDAYTWKLLPYGTYKSFIRSMQFRNSVWYSMLLAGGIALGVYLLIDKGIQLYKK